MATAESSWTVPADHPAFAGHFPSRPIVPGVVLLDHAIVLAGQLLGRPHEGGWQVAQAKFFVPVGPAQVVHFSLQTTPRGAVAFTARCDDREVASGSLVPPAP
jgi:3-hydroxyacyl-[acyl-carrier-protein] dehydratase